MAVISKGITLSFYCEGDTWEELTNLQEIPELGGEAEAIEITTLADEAHVYTDGIKNYGDALTFKFLYEKKQFDFLHGGELTTPNGNIISGSSWRVTLPDGTYCEFNAVSSVKLDGVGVNAALTYTLNLRPFSAMVWGTEE